MGSACHHLEPPELSRSEIVMLGGLVNISTYADYLVTPLIIMCPAWGESWETQAQLSIPQINPTDVSQAGGGSRTGDFDKLELNVPRHLDLLFFYRVFNIQRRLIAGYFDGLSTTDLQYKAHLRLNK